MALCDNCLFYDKAEDEFRQEYDDCLVVGYDEPPKHYCPMYDNNIPMKIFYKNADCQFYEDATKGA